MENGWDRNWCEQLKRTFKFCNKAKCHSLLTILLLTMRVHVHHFSLHDHQVNTQINNNTYVMVTNPTCLHLCLDNWMTEVALTRVFVYQWKLCEAVYNIYLMKVIKIPATSETESCDLNFLFFLIFLWHTCRTFRCTDSFKSFGGFLPFFC